MFTADPSAAEEIMALLDAFNGVLQEEHAALGDHDAERLEAVVERKSALLAELESAIGKHGIAGRTSSPQWNEVRRLASTCAEANRINGGAIMLNRNLVAGLLDIAHGNRLGSSTYTAAGRLRQRGASLGVGYV